MVLDAKEEASETCRIVELKGHYAGKAAGVAAHGRHPELLRPEVAEQRAIDGCATQKMMMGVTGRMN